MRHAIVAFAVGGILAACSEASDTAEAYVVPEEAACEAIQPSGFDCAEPGQVEELVCSDDELARMDRELARLADLVRSGPNASAQRTTRVDGSVSDFYRDIEECWKGIDLRQCTLTAYASQIAQIRESNADARAADDEGLSLGPFAYRCEGIDALIGATFVNTDPGAVFLAWGGSQMSLTKAQSGSGSRYSGKWDDFAWEFWIKGDEATFTTPDGERACRQEDIG